MGFQGACPLAEYEAAPHARRQARRRSPSAPPVRVPFADCLLSIDSSAIVAMLPSALSGSCSLRCPLVFSIAGVLPSLNRSEENQSPGPRRSAATSQSPQLGASAYQQKTILLNPLCCRSAGLRFAGLGCLAVVERIVNFSRRPQPVQHYCQLARHSHNRSPFGPFAATLRLAQSPRA
jgi:hypothetical protein